MSKRYTVTGLDAQGFEWNILETDDGFKALARADEIVRLHGTPDVGVYDNLRDRRVWDVDDLEAE